MLGMTFGGKLEKSAFYAPTSLWNMAAVAATLGMRLFFMNQWDTAGSQG
jgi:hypothetical protein